MDENRVRRLLRNLADTGEPPARIDIGQAMTQGRRDRRFRNAGKGGSMLAVGAVVGAVIAMAIVPGPRPAVTPQKPATAHASIQPTPRSTDQGTRSPHNVPKQFNPLIPYASFGWLPEGYTTVGPNSATAAPGSVTAATNSTALTAIAPVGEQGSFWLHVMATGACTDRDMVVNCHWDSGAVTGPLSLKERAPDVNGRPAYWTDGDSILWEYAPGAWATMVGPGGYQSARSAAVQALILKVAAGVRYGYGTPLVFPFWLSGVPASWQPEGADFIDSLPAPHAMDLDLGPAVKPQAAEISVMPASENTACQFIKGESRYVVVDGVKGILQIPSSYYQWFCISNLHGQLVSVQLSMRVVQTGAQVPGAAAIGGAAGLFKHLHLLGSQVSNWTTDPLR